MKREQKPTKKKTGSKKQPPPPQPAGQAAPPSGQEEEAPHNRTGLFSTPRRAKAMQEGASGASTDTDGGEDADELREVYLKEAHAIGSRPDPTKDVGGTGDPAVFGDKLAERLAFERTGTRLYEALLGKLEVQGGFPGGPSADELRAFHDQEAAHFTMLEECMKQLGMDPTAITPSADLAALESMGIGQVLGDPRTSLGEGLHAILVAELADREGWRMLIDLARKAGHDALAERFQGAEEEEEEHLTAVRAWVSAHVTGLAGVA